MLGTHVSLAGEEPTWFGKVPGQLHPSIMGDARAFEEVDVDGDAVAVNLLRGVRGNSVEQIVDALTVETSRIVSFF